METKTAPIRVLNLGAGVQSTVLYLMLDFDVAIFADTMEEPKAVYEHLEWLKSLGRTPILVRSRGCLGDNLRQGLNGTGQQFISIPAFIAATEGKPDGVGRRQCTSEYKVDVIDRTIRREILGMAPRQRVPKHIHVEQAYGISVDEAGRAMRIRRNWLTKWSQPVFPLLDRFMSRRDCKEWLKSYGVPHLVPRSACTFCPYKSNYDWRELRDSDPEGWKRAVEIDEILRKPNKEGFTQQQYVHSSCLPLAQADINNDSYGAQYTLGFATECTGGCGL